MSAIPRHQSRIATSPSAVIGYPERVSPIEEKKDAIVDGNIAVTLSDEKVYSRSASGFISAPLPVAVPSFISCQSLFILSYRAKSSLRESKRPGMF